MSPSTSGESPRGDTTTETPDRATGAVGTPRPRVEGRAKVTGAARYAADVPMPDLAHDCIVTATVSRGRISHIDAAAVTRLPGVLGVIDHTNAPRLNRDAGNVFGPHGGLHLLQVDDVPHAGRPIALVVAETPEQARAAADALPITYDEAPHDIAFSADHPAARSAFAELSDPVRAMLGDAATDAVVGDVEAELAASAVVVDERYRTPEEHCSAMEPHAAIAWWAEGRLHAVDSNQGPFNVAVTLATLFSLDPAQVHVRADHVGGGFGSKGLCGPQLILAAMATTRFGRPVRVALTRNDVFLATAMRPVTDQWVRLGADADGRLRAIDHRPTFSTSRLGEYIEFCTEVTKTLYAAPAIHTQLRSVPMDLLPPFSMRGPGTTNGSFALESAMDELAERLDMDPLELRLRNEPTVGPVSGLPFSRRNLVACMHEGSRRFGWAGRDRRPRRRREGQLLVGSGMAAVSFSSGAFPSTATITAEPDGTFTVSIGATDLGTGARTALAAIAADALHVDTDRIRLLIADSDLGPAWDAGGSRGTTSWAWAITETAANLRERLPRATLPLTVSVDTMQLMTAQPTRERHAFSSVFAEVTVDPATGEVRVRRLLGMFAVGRVVNPLLARGQVVGGMIMGLSMALHEEALRDPISGRHVNADFAGYHIAAHADVPDIEADFVADYDPDGPSGIKGAGEIGAVGTAAAIANAVWHATGTRHRSVPIRLDHLIETEPSS
jgi:xanthine dehydrogenase YagR molybdenum-binding subunit